MTIEQEYISKLKDKDEIAFEYVYNNTKRAVYSMVFSVIKNHQLTEDIMQDVYMKMLSSIHQYQERTNFYNWLLQIAKNQAIDYYRKSSKSVKLDITDYEELIHDPEETPDEKDQFNRMIEILNDDERTIVLLKVVDGLKHQQIAKIIKKPLGTVLWIYQRAIKKLEGLEDHDEKG